MTGARVSVIGLGKSGLAACRLLKSKGALTFASDSSDIDKEILNELKILDIDFELSGHTKKCVEDKNFIVVSPGVPPDSFPLNEARKRKIPIYSEIELGFWFIDTPIVAITGTNGKTTTVTLLGEMLEAIGKKVAICGNIGVPLSKVAMDAGEKDVIVMEVSSFQLETIRDFRPRVSVLLNITPNHLDRYSGDISAYSQAKANLFKNQGKGDFAILNRDDERVRAVSIPAEVSKVYFSNSAMSSWQSGEPGGNQLQVHDEMLVSYLNAKEERIISSLELRLPGRHNLANVLAACGVVLSLFPEERNWLEALAQFKGLPHRLEAVRKINGITFINDSKSTSVDATLKAVQSISGPVILIAGGRDKGSPFELLREIITSRVRRLILFGEAKDKMADALRGTTRVLMAGTLREAVSIAFSEAFPGDYVLLSPACASFDMFRNFEDRGDTFKEIVRSLQSNGNS